MYKIFIVTNRTFGDIDCIIQNDRDTANAIWKDLMSTGAPIITVKDNSFKIWNVKQIYQPEVVTGFAWPGWVTTEWNRRKSDNYLGAKLINWDILGCYELEHATMTDAGAKRLDRVFYTYDGDMLFSVTQYD